MTARMANALGATVLAALLTGCAAAREYERKDGARLPAAVARTLPTVQNTLAGAFCPEFDDIRGAQLDRELRSAEADLQALLAAARPYPNALLKTTYFSSDDGPDAQDMTLRELVRDHIPAAHAMPLSDLPRPCRARTVRLRRELRSVP